jgi:hypothetical protein
MADEEVAEIQVVPVSEARVQNCRKSAAFWVNELPRYADKMQRRADFWAIAAGILAAATSVAVFPILSDTSTFAEQLLVSGAAFLSAICALFPRVMNYAEAAGSARELSSRYGGIVGDLIDLAEAKPFNPAAARPIVEEFEAIKERKDGLRGLPDRDAIEMRRADVARRLAEAELRRAEVEKAAAEARKAANAAKAVAGQ